MNPEHSGPFVKPEIGTAKRDKHERKSVAKAKEKAEMDAAKRRDRMKCRWPGCDTAKLGMVIDGCHQRNEHRGIGGNPDGTRTERRKVITFCRLHHKQYDRFEIGVEPLTDALFDGACAFYRGDQHIASEKIIGVSVTRSEA